MVGRRDILNSERDNDKWNARGDNMAIRRGAVLNGGVIDGRTGGEWEPDLWDGRDFIESISW